MIRNSMILLCLAVSCFGLVGCAEAPPATSTAASFGSEDGLLIAELIEDFNEAKSDSAKLAKLFVSTPSLPVKSYDRLMFSIVGKPDVMGETATAAVTIVDDANSKPVAKPTWKFVKVNGKWKLKDAPLS